MKLTLERIKHIREKIKKNLLLSTDQYKNRNRVIIIINKEVGD